MYRMLSDALPGLPPGAGPEHNKNERMTLIRFRPPPLKKFFPFYIHNLMFITLKGTLSISAFRSGPDIVRSMGITQTVENR